MIKNFENEIIPYIMIGDDSLEKSKTLLDLYANSGCSIIEIGVPFSDPTADGITIQKASIRALNNQITVKTCLEFISEASITYPNINFILMSYFNPVLQYGLKAFFSEFKGAGLIIPDLPFEEYHMVNDLCNSFDVAIIPLLSINTPQERVKMIVENANGFIYLMTLKGLTGTKSANVKDSIEMLNSIRELTDTPVVAGFGIKNTEQIHSFLEHFNGVVIASQLLKYAHINDYNSITKLLYTKKTVI